MLSSDEFLETVEAARDCLRSDRSDAALTRDFARALVQAADTCLIGVACDKHGGEIHGREAEELRAGVEQIINTVAQVHDDDSLFGLGETRRALIVLLDRVDARDSLAFREATDGADDVDAKVEALPCRDDDEAYRERCAGRRAFFAARSVGDKVSWGRDRSGLIQKIEEEYVTILDDGWPADPPHVVYTPPLRRAVSDRLHAQPHARRGSPQDGVIPAVHFLAS